MELKIVSDVSFSFHWYPLSIIAYPAVQANNLKSLHHPLLLSSTPSGLPLGGSHNLQLEILQGRDESMDVGDFMGGDRAMGEVLDPSGAMERSRGM
jgi:proteasome maturation protein